MAEGAKRMTVWTGYFDVRLSRSEGRRVGRDVAIPKPTLDTIAYAARACGITKMRREQTASHSARPHASEGRLVMSTADALQATGAESKEGVMRVIGVQLAKEYSEQKEATRVEKERGPKKGDRRSRSQRGGKASQGKRGSKPGSGQGKRGGQRR
jgi:signal recognition particle subunit SEC65